MPVVQIHPDEALAPIVSISPDLAQAPVVQIHPIEALAPIVSISPDLAQAPVHPDEALDPIVSISPDLAQAPVVYTLQYVYLQLRPCSMNIEQVQEQQMLLLSRHVQGQLRPL